MRGNIVRIEQVTARCVIILCLLVEGDCHIELQLEGDRNVGKFDKAAG